MVQPEMVGPLFISSCICYNHLCPAWSLAKTLGADAKRTPTYAATPVTPVAHKWLGLVWGTSRVTYPGHAGHHSHGRRQGHMSLRRCAWHNCPQLVKQGTRFCAIHTHAYERQRGSSTARGYDAAHRHLRRAWEARLATGETHICAKCGQPVTAADQWDLGHTDNRQSWTGPEHRSCNRKDGQHKATASAEHWTRHQAKPLQQPQSQPTGKPQTQTRHDTNESNASRQAKQAHTTKTTKHTPKQEKIQSTNPPTPLGGYPERQGQDRR